jgi:hypothetical protein
MPVALVISLLTTFGPSAVQLITSLISKWETNGSVTAAEWAALTVSLTQTAQDRMKAQLVAAGIDPTSPQGLAMLALAK